MKRFTKSMSVLAIKLAHPLEHFLQCNGPPSGFPKQLRYALRNTGFRFLLPLACLFALPALGLGSRTEAGYVAAPSLTQSELTADHRLFDRDFDAGASCQNEEPALDSQDDADRRYGDTDPQKAQVIRLADTLSPVNQGGTTGTGGASSSGSGAVPVGIVASSPIQVEVVVRRLYLAHQFFIPTPSISGLFRPPRAAV
jgi:hypothetical protein